ncbi:MAG: hypothetical protein KGL02_14880, partial [Acidobacteriota bacterium]|nr:hypothetical protein [Acidobacteriota bacterium]
MNRSIVRLFAVVILMFSVLVVWTSRWTVFSATALNNNSLNKLQFFATEKIKRGRILAGNGDVLAKSVRGSGGLWTRRYPFGSLFSQAVGFNILSSQGNSAGLEQSSITALQGKRNALTNLFG